MKKDKILGPIGLHPRMTMQKRSRIAAPLKMQEIMNERRYRRDGEP